MMNWRKTGIVVLCGSVLTFATGADHHAPAPAPAHHDAPAAPAAPAPATAQPAKADATVTADAALERLLQGNDRFVSNTSEHARADQARRCDTSANGQHPFAVVLACADSRVPVELLFDQGIGDLFTVRVAGNVADVDEIGTVEYGVGHLGAPLIVVLGHGKCGAVTAVANDAKLPPNIAKLVDNIKPAAERVKRENPNLKGDALVAASIRANVFQSIEDMLTHSDEIRELVAQGKVKVVGGVYDIHGGTVQWLGPHPNQSQLLRDDGKTAHRPDEELLKGDAARQTHDVHQTRETHESREANEPHQASGARETSGALDKNAPHETTNAAHETNAAHDEPTKPAAEHGAHSDASSGTKTKPQAYGGLLMPAAFLGGAGIMSGAVIYAIKPRGTAAAAKDASTEGAGATNA